MFREIRAEISFARRGLMYSREYMDLDHAILDSKGLSFKYFELPPIFDRLSGVMYVAGRRCRYRLEGFVALDSPLVAEADFTGCAGAWSMPLVHVSGRGFSAEPQLSHFNIAMKFGKPQLKQAGAPRHVAGEAFSLLGPCSANWYHTLIDQLSLVPRWIAGGLKDRGVKLLMPAYWAYRWPELPALLGIDAEAIIWHGEEPLRLERLLMPIGVRVRSVSRWARATVEQNFANPVDLQGLRTLLLSRLDPPVPGLGRRCVIDRGDGWRPARTKYFSALSDELVARWGFERVFMGRLKPHEQLQVFRDSEIVVGEHGAGLASFVAASEGTHVVEVLPVSPAELSIHGFNYIAAALSHQRYHTLVDAPVSRTLGYIERLLGLGRDRA